jgi:hypothetical protein
MPIDRDTVVIVVVILLGAGLFMGGILGINYWLENKRCSAAYESYQYQYGLFSGCRIMWNDKLTPVSIIRELQ